MTNKEIHELATKLPEMGREEYQALKESISRNGLIQDIILYQDKILDGRHRYRACSELGIEPRYSEYRGSSPVAYVIAQNVNRRHLTPSQRAVLAVELLPDIEREAQKRSRANLVQYQDANKETKNIESANVFPTASNEAIGAIGRSSTLAARLLEVSKSSVERAKKAKEVAPEKWEDIKRGEETVSGVLAELKLKEKMKSGDEPDQEQTYKGVESAGVIIEMATKTQALQKKNDTKKLLKLNTRPCAIEILSIKSGYTIIIGNAHAHITQEQADAIADAIGG